MLPTLISIHFLLMESGSGTLAPDGLNQLYLKLMLLKELNNVLLLNLYEASSFS